MTTRWEEGEPISVVADDGTRINLIIVGSVGETGQNRIVPRKRPGRPGAKLDTTGNGEDTFSLVLFFPGRTEEDGQTSTAVTEPGVTDDDGLPMYPERLFQVRDFFKKGETFTLNLLYQRGLRVKAESWTITETVENERNTATMQVMFRADNEDSVDREAMLQQSPRATVTRKVDDAVFSAEAVGAWVPNVSELYAAAQEVLAAVRSASEPIDHIKSRITQMRSLISSTMDALSTPFDGRNQLIDSEAGGLRLRLLELDDAVASAEAEWRKSHPRTTTYYSERDTTVWAIAVLLKQDVHTLMELNAGSFEDFSQIPAGVGFVVLA